MRYNGDFETILNSIYPPVIIHKQSKSIHYDDNGDGFVVSYDDSNRSSCVALIIHGWWGNINTPIVKRYSVMFKKLGYSIACINLKDHINDYTLCKSLFSFGDINYIEKYIDCLKVKFDKIIMLSFSFGANLTLRLKNINELDRVILISPVFNIASAFQCIERKLLYKTILLKRWKSYLNKKQLVFPKQYDFSSSLKGKSIDDVVNGFISYIGYNTIDQYYKKNSIVKEHLYNIKVRTLLIHAQNDPIIQLSNISPMNEAIRANKFIYLCILENGGHCPYAKKNIFNWIEDL